MVFFGQEATFVTCNNLTPWLIFLSGRVQSLLSEQVLYHIEHPKLGYVKRNDNWDLLPLH